MKVEIWWEHIVGETLCCFVILGAGVLWNLLKTAEEALMAARNRDSKEERESSYMSWAEPRRVLSCTDHAVSASCLYCPFKSVAMHGKTMVRLSEKDESHFWSKFAFEVSASSEILRRFRVS